MKVIKYIPVNHADLPPKVLKCGADSQSISLKKTIDCELFKIHYNMYSILCLLELWTVEADRNIA